MLDPEIKKIWLNALRSEISGQAFGYLVQEDGCKCAMGVLLQALECPIIEDDMGEPAFEYGGRRLYKSPPAELIPPHVQTRVIDWNDVNQLSFSEIADLIERKF